ncbi:MAG: ATP-grasp domain-containing protein [Thermodesulfobacteriota bacterium]
MILSFHPCITADRQVILGSRSPGLHEAKLAARADAVLLPQTCRESLYRLCRDGGAKIFPSYDLRFAYPGKSGQAQLFSERGLPHPDTRIWSSVAVLRDAVRVSEDLPLKPPFLVKTDTDHEGLGIYVIRSLHDLESALADLGRRRGEYGEKILTQELVPVEGNVLRAVILARRVLTYWKRSRGAFITTIGKGAMVDISWRKDLQEKGRRLAGEICKALGINLAAVDMVFNMQEPEPEPLVLEINYMFGRRGLGGSEVYYRLLFEAVKEWLEENGLDSKGIGLV